MERAHRKCCHFRPMFSCGGPSGAHKDETARRPGSLPMSLQRPGKSENLLTVLMKKLSWRYWHHCTRGFDDHVYAPPLKRQKHKRSSSVTSEREASRRRKESDKYASNRRPERSVWARSSCHATSMQLYWPCGCLSTVS